MEAAGLAIGAIGLIPVVVKCERVTQLCEEIVNLEDKLAEVKEANPKSTMLLQHVNDLKAKLENLQEVLQDLVPTKLWKRSIYHDTIDLKLTELLQVVETCNSSFVASSTCHLVCTNEKIRRDVEKVQVVEHKTDSLIIAVSDLRQQMDKACNSQWLKPEAIITVQVRSFGCPNGRECAYALKPKQTISCIINRMRKENYNIQDIHFFSWSQYRHRLTKSGQDWRYRQKNDRILTIQSECGRKDGVDVDWRLEYICNPAIFTLFLVHGLQQEAGLMLDFPIETISPERLLEVYPSHLRLRILKCHSMQTGAAIDWTDSQALSRVTPHNCSLCVEVGEDHEDTSMLVD